MLETIKSYEKAKAEEVKHTTFVKSDDGTLVFFKDKFDPETGTKLPDEVIRTFNRKEIEDEIAKKQEELDVLNNFLNEINV